MPHSPTPDPEPATLERAIETSHPERLAETLIAVCEKSAEAKAMVSSLLLTDIKADAIKDAGKKEQLMGQKRKRWEACGKCDEEFDVENNEDGGCQWHAGELEISPDTPLWKDPQVEIDEDTDPEAIAEIYPEAVRFSCCKEGGDDDGCMKGKHRAMTAEKIARLEGLQSEDISDDE